MSSNFRKLFKFSKTESEKAEAVNRNGMAGTSSFFRAIEKGSLSRVLEKLHDGADIHARSQAPGLIGNMVYTVPYAAGSTPLHVAALLGHDEIVFALLRRGADVNARNNDGYTPIDYALQGYGFYNDLAEKRLDGNSLTRRFGKSAQRNALAFDNIISMLRRHGGDSALFALPQRFADIEPQPQPAPRAPHGR